MIESSTVKVAVPREIVPGELRVALVPDTVARLVKGGLAITVESGAGERAQFADAAYEHAGAALGPAPTAVYAEADAILKVQRPVRNDAVGKHEVELMRQGAVLISFLQPLTSQDVVRRLAAQRVTSFSLDALPRITRAQGMDALSSQSTVAGYKAVLVAANALGRFFPMLMTAAGTVVPARVLVLGAGVAGLQAIATARRLGAVVEAYDVRPAVKEEVHSLGATFLELPLDVQGMQDASGYAREQSADFLARQRELLGQHVRQADVVITTAVIPGRPAPILVTEEMVVGMRPGSVIVDLAAETGGNCQLTEPGAVVVRHGIAIHGVINLAALLPTHASQLYSRNISAFLLNMVRDNELRLNFEDDILRATCITHDGQVVHAPTRALVEAGQPASP
jgi:NAD(P) transhydrogenase subunit alpha